MDWFEGYVYYATLYKQSPELIKSKFKVPDAELDNIFRRVTWRVVTHHPLSGVTDNSGNEGSFGRHKTLEDFRQRLRRDLTPAKATDLFGKPDRQIGSGLIIYVYDLDDGTAIWLGFPGYGKILYSKHVQANGKKEDIPLKPQETSP